MTNLQIFNMVLSIGGLCWSFWLLLRQRKYNKMIRLQQELLQKQNEHIRQNSQVLFQTTISKNLMHKQILELEAEVKFKQEMIHHLISELNGKIGI
jgi:hypothetical protein